MSLPRVVQIFECVSLSYRVTKFNINKITYAHKIPLRTQSHWQYDIRINQGFFHRYMYRFPINRPVTFGELVWDYFIHGLTGNLYFLLTDDYTGVFQIENTSVSFLNKTMPDYDKFQILTK